MVIPTAVLFAVGACVNQDLDEMEEREQQIISDYLTESNISPESKTQGGIYFIERQVGTGPSPVKDQYVVINYAGRLLEDLSIRETNYDSLKSEWPLANELENYYFGPLKLQYGYSMPGINEALSLMKEGGKATAIIPSNKANYDNIPLLYDIELIKVIGNLQRYEDSVINIYSQQNFGDTAQIDTVGIWTRIEHAPVTNNIFESGDTMFFNFTAKTVHGFGDSPVADHIFDSNTGGEPVRYVYGQNTVPGDQMLLFQNKIVKGLKTAIDSMTISQGMKFTVLMNYNQAFGVASYLHPVDKYIMVPPYQAVEYLIEVTEIRPE